MHNTPTAAPAGRSPGEDKLTILVKDVALVRSGLIADLHSAADEIGSLAESTGREAQDALGRWEAVFARLDDARTLLGVIGSHADVEHDVTVDLSKHRKGLLGALRLQLEAELGHAESLPVEQQTDAQARIAVLVGLAERAGAPS